MKKVRTRKMFGLFVWCESKYVAAFSERQSKRLQNRFDRISKYWCMVDLALQPNQMAITDRRYVSLYIKLLPNDIFLHWQL